MRIDFCKTRDVKSPNRNTKEDAGVDFYIPMCYLKKHVDITGESYLEYTESSKKFLQDLRDKNGDRIKIEEPKALGENLKIWIPIGSRVLIPSGIKVKIRRGIIRRFLNWMFGLGDALIANNKSGVANNKGLVVGSSVVDYEYQGEVHLSLINTGNEDICIESGEKIVQFIHFLIYLSEYNQIPQFVYDKFSPSERGKCGFGSSNDK